MTASCADLVALAERELELARAQRWEELPAVLAQRAALAAARTPPPPGPERERLRALQDETVARLRAARASVAAELGRLSRGHGAVRGYHAAAACRGMRVDDSG